MHGSDQALEMGARLPWTWALKQAFSWGVLSGSASVERGRPGAAMQPYRGLSRPRLRLRAGLSELSQTFSIIGYVCPRERGMSLS